MSKRHRSSAELLPHDVVELILERLPVKFVLKFKSVSKKWKSTFESQRFKEKQSIRRTQSRGADFLVVSIGDDYNGNDEASKGRIVLGSSIICTVRFPTPITTVCHGSCNGLLCLSHASTANFVINPATRWHRSFPHSIDQQLTIDMFSKSKLPPPNPRLGFGKDTFKGIYKAVSIHNLCDLSVDKVTTCEVFDFGTNAWRYVFPASPYRILSCHKPVYLDGSLYWFTECDPYWFSEGEETKVLSFDLHTETFQVISKPPFSDLSDPRKVNMCILDNRLCISDQNWPTQVIWSLHSSGGNKTWEKMCSIDLTKTFSLFVESFTLFPLAMPGKNKLLLQGREYLRPLVTYDLRTKSYDLVFQPTTTGRHCVQYFQSLFSL